MLKVWLSGGLLLFEAVQSAVMFSGAHGWSFIAAATLAVTSLTGIPKIHHCADTFFRGGIDSESTP